MRAQWYAMERLFGRSSEASLNSRRAASASVVSMKSQALTRASGPTRYQPACGPSDRMNGNLRYDQERTSSSIMSP